MSDPSVLVTTASSSDTDPNPNSPRLRAALIVLGILGAIGVGIIIWWTMRFKVRDSLPFGESTKKSTSPASGETAAGSSGASNSLGRNRSKRESVGEGIVSVLRSGSITLKRSFSSTLASTKSKSKSLAAKITPFNQSSMDPTKLHDGDGPRFVHTPGLNMRVATRLSNGVWQFSEPMRGGLGSPNPFASSSQASLLNQRPATPYLSPTSAGANANPFSDHYASSPTSTSPISPTLAEDPFLGNGITVPRRQGTADSTQSTVHFTDASASSTRSRAGTLPQGPIYRGTIYDLERAERGRPHVPAGINDLEEDLMKKKGTPLPVMESELMRRGLRNSVGSVALLNSADGGTSGLSRSKSNDTLATFGKELGRRPSAGSAVLLGGTGPVGASHGRTRNGTYHPDLDDVIDITTTDGRKATEGSSSAQRERARDGNHADDKDDAREGRLRRTSELDALPTPVSGGMRHGLSPYRESTAYTSTVGHETPPITPQASSFVGSSRSRASHIAQPSVGSTLTTATSLYPHDVGSRTAGTIYLGSMTSLGYATPRPSLGDAPRPSLDREPPVPSLPSVYYQNHQHPSETSNEFDPDVTLLVDPTTPTTVHPYSPTSTTFTHSASVHLSKKGYELDSEIHGYGFSDFGRLHKGTDAGLGVDDFDAADESMYGHSFEGDAAAIISIHERGPDRATGQGRKDKTAWRESVDIVDLPNIPPPEYKSPKKQQSRSASGKSRS